MALVKSNLLSKQSSIDEITVNLHTVVKHVRIFFFLRFPMRQYNQNRMKDLLLVFLTDVSGIHVLKHSNLKFRDTQFL